MKKILLAVFTLLMISATFAQTRVEQARRSAQPVPMHKTYLTGFEEGATPEIQTPMLRDASHNYIGMTYYDCQSNGSVSSKIVAHNDGTVSTVWTTLGATAASRGTGYNYYNGSYWIFSPTSTDRIENTRTGWSTLTTVGNAEITVAHNGSSALVIGVCPQKGTNNWTFTNLQGPSISSASGTSTALLWPAVASSGNTIHLIACTESDEGYYYNGINTCLVYYRGTYDESTATITWESPRVVGNVTADEYSRFSGDSYAITAKGNTVAIVALPSSTMDAFLWKSTDNGVNFTKTVFLESAIKNGNLTAMLDTNLYVQDGIGAVAIGDDGIVHVAFGAYLVVSDVDSGDSWYWYPSIGELVYWNENQAPILYNGDDTYMQPEVLRAAGHTVIERFNLDCDESIWSVSNWDINSYPSYGAGSVSFPQLVAENGKVYMVFCQLMEFPFVDASGSMYYRGVFGTKSLDNGQTFGDYSWLSYNKDCYYLDSWELFPLDSTTTLADVEEYTEMKGESVYPSVAPRLVNGKIFMTWEQDMHAGSWIKEAPDDAPISVCPEESSIYYLTMDADEIGVYNNTNEVCQGLWIDHTGLNNRTISGMKMYPNPASESVNITFSAEKAESGVISVMNLMGQTIYTSNVDVNEGYNKVIVPVKNFSNGVYMVTLRTNTGISTQKLIVK